MYICTYWHMVERKSTECVGYDNKAWSIVNVALHSWRFVMLALATLEILANWMHRRKFGLVF